MCIKFICDLLPNLQFACVCHRIWRPTVITVKAQLLRTLYMFLTGSSGGGASRGEPDVSLHEVLTSDSLRPLSQDEEFQQTVNTHLPPTNESAMTGVTSPQFQQVWGTCTMYVIYCEIVHVHVHFVCVL